MLGTEAAGVTAAMSLPRTALLSLLLVLGDLAPALADTPPPPGYEETCTVELREQAGTTCKACEASPGAGGDPDVCKKKFASTKFTYVCRTYGGSFWTEVWCDGPPRDVTGCSCEHLGAAPPAALGGTLAGFAAVLLALRRRRAR